MPTKQASKSRHATSPKRLDGRRARRDAGERTRAKGRLAGAARARSAAEGEATLRRSIAEMPGRRPRHGRADPRARHGRRAGLVPKTYYGMPAYAKDGKVICFFQAEVEVQGPLLRHSASSPRRSLDDGAMWPIAFAVTELTPPSRRGSPSS